MHVIVHLRAGMEWEVKAILAEYRSIKNGVLILTYLILWNDCDGLASIPTVNCLVI
jgi:hypothetical protein